MSTPNGSTARQTVPNFTREEMQQVFRPWLDWSEDAELLTLHQLVLAELVDRGHEEIAVEIGGEEE